MGLKGTKQLRLYSAQTFSKITNITKIDETMKPKSYKETNKADKRMSRSSKCNRWRVSVNKGT